MTDQPDGIGGAGPSPRLRRLITELCVAPADEADQVSVVEIADAKAEFPDLDLWVLGRRGDPAEPDVERVLIHRGDVRAGLVDLDFDPVGDSPQDAPEAPYVVLVIVVGNASIDTVISAETDGAISLAVTGDLRLGQAAVGGQEIHVGGSLNVDGLFFGSYNHGTCQVLGDCDAGLLICDDYTFAVGGELRAPVAGTGGERLFKHAPGPAASAAGFDSWERHQSAEIPLALAVEPRFLCEWGPDFGEAVRAMRSGERVVVTQVNLADLPDTCPPVPDEGLPPSPEGIAWLQNLPMFAANVEVFGIHDGDDFVRVVRPHIDSDGEHTTGSVYIQDDECKWWYDATGGRAWTAPLGSDVRLVEPHEQLQAARRFARIYQVLAGLQTQQQQTPPAEVSQWLDQWVDDEPEADHDIAWYTLTRADEPDEDGDVADGDRLKVLGGDVTFTYEVDQGVLIRYWETDDTDARYPIPVGSVDLHRQAVAQFVGARAFLAAVAD